MIKLEVTSIKSTEWNDSTYFILAITIIVHMEMYFTTLGLSSGATAMTKWFKDRSLTSVGGILSHLDVADT